VIRTDLNALDLVAHGASTRQPPLARTAFRMVGITREINGWSDRLNEHERYASTLVALASATRII
jgi:hypothetical protein